MYVLMQCFNNCGHSKIDTDPATSQHSLHLKTLHVYTYIAVAIAYSVWLAIP